MCLRYILSKKEQKKIKDEITKEGLKVYKVVLVRNKRYHPPYFDLEPYSEGTMTATIQKVTRGLSGISYNSGFHFFKTKEEAQDLCELKNAGFYTGYEVITCIIKKSWITQIGVEHGHKYNRELLEIVIVAKKAIFPKFMEKETEKEMDNRLQDKRREDDEEIRFEPQEMIDMRIGRDVTCA